ncbi:hypothetical protein [uncultured Bacteroides sp.]|uniref:hypothetical protein n=1 Tax=uncultured Bacteroides sp. TaxID=162156 RepID=UPI00260BAD4A|nr:hypothetical protein [uncultured Bacteroides sp.]
MKNDEKKKEEIQLIKTGMNDNVNLLNEDELGEIFAGYTYCPNLYCKGGFVDY